MSDAKLLELGPVLTAISHGLNALLRMDEESAAKLVKMQGKVMRVVFKEFRLQWFMLFTPHGVILQDEYEGPIDVTISGHPVTLINLMAQSGTKLSGEGVQIEGDIHFAQQIQQLFAELECDWEESLSHWVGDVVAHQVGEFVREAKKEAVRIRQVFRENLTEYAQEEARLLPTRVELDEFYEAVDELRLDVERASARWERIKSKR